MFWLAGPRCVWVGRFTAVCAMVGVSASLLGGFVLESTADGIRPLSVAALDGCRGGQYCAQCQVVEAGQGIGCDGRSVTQREVDDLLLIGTGQSTAYCTQYPVPGWQSCDADTRQRCLRAFICDRVDAARGACVDCADAPDLSDHVNSHCRLSEARCR